MRLVSAPVWLTTERLALRRPRADDLDDYVRLHTDPRTYAHSPASMPTPEGCRERLSADLSDWERAGLGYAAVVDRATGAVIGWAGLRHKDSDASALNLYYRLAFDRLGRGFGLEIARAVVAWGVEHRPDDLVTAMVDEVNTASRRTAERSGLFACGTRAPRDDPHGEPMLYLEAPRVSAVPTGDVDALRDDIVDLWVRVNDAGGSVGFLPGAPRADVAAALDRHLDDVRSGRSLLCVLREPAGPEGEPAGPQGDRAGSRPSAAGPVRGIGLWEHALGFPYEHVAGLKRLMVDPQLQGRNLGRILLGGMVGIARRDLPHVELLRLDYRDGLGLGEFYGRAGWSEVGRVPRGLKLTESDYRDDVAMARRVDGAPLR
ncbi:RimJ/RimL family protein N-acetyltransferase [Humibacillus xanthopallidus]|uniref:RimJ/RimL family protein N-acetyltransferase n=1 Tax=Humibacillus xanthopallidus TaxID=412689 RepID=A0A543PTE4_9MICO|nr:RimJ/RimL family protein N-acetyltransferase [Humibacillus xanthopallidus]